MYKIVYTTRNISGEWFWVTNHETLEETAEKAQAFIMEHWDAPPIGPKQIVYNTDDEYSEGGSTTDPAHVAAIVLSHRADIEVGDKLYIKTELVEIHRTRNLNSLEIYKPSAVQAKEEAERTRRRATGHVHCCGDELCDGDCGELPCGCFRECWCKNGKGLRRFLERGY